MRSVGDMSKDLAFKLWWCLRRNNFVWSGFMHLKDNKGLHPSRMQVSMPLLVWRWLEHIQEVESKIRWCLGKGFMDFWYDRWLSEVPLADMVSIGDPPRILVAEFYRHDG